MITPEQIRAARALLGINQDKLAERASVGVATIRRLETSSGKTMGNTRTLWKIQIALEEWGIRFLDETDNLGPGVRLIHPRKSKNLKSPI